MPRVNVGPKSKFYTRDAGGRVRRAEPGEEVEVTDAQAKAFKSSFDTAGAPKGTSGKAQDTGAKTHPGEPNALAEDEPGPGTGEADRKLKRGR